MAPLTKSVREGPQIAPRNSSITEFEGGRQKAVYEYTRLPP